MVSGTNVTDARRLSTGASPRAFNVKSMFAKNVLKK
jgi:hypothetical protein